MLSTLGLLVAFSGDAEARHGRHAAHHGRVVVAPRGHVRFTIGVGPWSPKYVPAPRAGFRWVAGYYVRGIWWPGYWEPVASPKPGMVWVPGHWQGEHYVEGYWRDANRAGMVWIEGSYDEDGNWIDGRWIDARDAEAYTNGPSGSGQNIEILPEDSATAIPFTVEEEDLSEPEEIHAPAPER
jgi:hypothetical protein